MTFLIQQTLIYAVPLMIVALAGVFAERSGIINLALEGIMIFGAFIGVLFVRLMQGSAAVFLLCYLLVMLSMFSIGMMVGGLAPDTKTASIAACVLYFPMLLLSGATLPYEVMPAVLQRIADFLPLTQGIKLLKASSLGLPMENVLLPVLVLVILLICCSLIAVRFFKWEAE